MARDERIWKVCVCFVKGNVPTPQSQSYIATDGQSVSLGVEPHLGLMTRYLLLFDSYRLVFCGARSLTRGRVCLLYMLLCPCQCSLSRLRVPWDSRSYFTLKFETKHYLLIVLITVVTVYIGNSKKTLSVYLPDDVFLKLETCSKILFEITNVFH
jgi:hypothetical protein